jgi:hypothetical protein
MTTRTTPVAPALPAVDALAANLLRPGTKAACLLGGSGDPAIVAQAPVGLPQAVTLAAGQRRRARESSGPRSCPVGGALLQPGHGYPARLTAPTNSSVTQTKWLQVVTVLCDEPPAGRRWWVGLAAGGAIGLFGLAGQLGDAAKTIPAVWGGWLDGLLPTHNLLGERVVRLADCFLRRMLEAWRRLVQVGLVASGVLALASVVALVWTGVLAPAAARHLHARGWTVRIRAP